MLHSALLVPMMSVPIFVPLFMREELIFGALTSNHFSIRFDGFGHWRIAWADTTFYPYSRSFFFFFAIEYPLVAVSVLFICRMVMFIYFVCVCFRSAHKLFPCFIRRWQAQTTDQHQRNYDNLQNKLRYGFRMKLFWLNGITKYFQSSYRSRRFVSLFCSRLSQHRRTRPEYQMTTAIGHTDTHCNESQNYYILKGIKLCK